MFSHNLIWTRSSNSTISLHIVNTRLSGGYYLDYLALLKGVSLFEKTPAYKGYKEFVLDKRQVWENIDKITESDIKGTVLEFLKRWNIRNVNRIDSHGLEKTLKELSKYFGVLCNKSLINLDFN